MKGLDWTVVALYLLCPFAVSLWFARRAGKNAESFLLAGRTLPWWVIGFSAAATYTSSGSSSIFSMLVYSGGLAGNWGWWLPYAIWMPLVAAIWSRYWRRLEVRTTAEFFEKRYAGPMASAYRTIHALVMGLGLAMILNGYVTGLLVPALSPVFGWSPGVIIGVFMGVTVLYCIVSGMFSAAYNDVPQFLVFLVGNLVFVPVVLKAAGGPAAVYQAVESTQSAGFLNPLPIGLGGWAVAAFMMQGLFFAASPTGGEGYTAQMFMCARNEFHAQLGQLFSSIMTLVVRMLPLIALGLVGTALYKGSRVPGEEVWGRLVSDYSVSGLTGLLVAAELAAFMSTVDTQVTWQTSYLVNDVYARIIRPGAGDRHYVLACRLCYVVLLTLAAVIGYYVATGWKGRVEVWFTYINNVMVAFLLPVAWLRFFWWRFNIYGEVAALVVGLPLGIILWFPLGFSERPAGVAFLTLFGLGWLVILTVTLLTRPEPLEKLSAFYRACKPPGFWGPVRAALSEEERARIRRDATGSLVEGALGVACCLGAVLLMTSLFGRWWYLAMAVGAAVAASGTVLILLWRRRGFFSGLSQVSGTAGSAGGTGAPAR